MFMKRDVESGGGGDRPLYPNMLENPQYRWSFIRKVYCILTFQLLLTVAVAAVVVFVRPIPHFIVSTTPGLVLYCVLIFIPFIMVVISLTIYTFIAARRGHDFNFLGPFLFGALLILIAFSLIQILFPLGKLSLMIYGGLASLIFCGYIIYDTDNLIKRFSYDQYIWASVSLYLDVINLFLSLLTLGRAASS
ncbi:Protein LIFEGUARD 4 [Vigna angularis]|uniref:Protein LIFEGUARD 4 n=1 Tax=Phaseolus angularis TaxID=3914 RepID=A0A8T0L0W8_PHAAN|nr:Protein LIFEGUARD 4 [Vigna angularis]